MGFTARHQRLSSKIRSFPLNCSSRLVSQIRLISPDDGFAMIDAANRVEFSTLVFLCDAITDIDLDEVADLFSKSEVRAFTRKETVTTFPVLNQLYYCGAKVMKPAIVIFVTGHKSIETSKCSHVQI
jgi:hypothetical protein